MKEIVQLIEEAMPYYTEGEIVDYIPILKNIDKSMFHASIIDCKGEAFHYGNKDHLFSMQSISKVISFIVASEHLGIFEMLKFVDLEPTGDPFNSIIRLESSEQGKPFNPLINAGAITTASLLPGETVSEKVDAVTEFIERISGVKCYVNEDIYQSELEHSYRNRAIAYYLKERGFINGTPEDALEVYLRLCSIEVTTEIVAKLGLVIANDGICPTAKEQFVHLEIIKVAKALMVTCGMYNYSGKYAAFIGIPSKSGVSGGIMCALSIGEIEGLQGPIGMGVFGPAIDTIGNSVVGIHFLRRLSEVYDLSIF